MEATEIHSGGVERTVMENYDIKANELDWTHLCNLCVDTRWQAHVMRDRLGDPHGEG